MTKGHKFRRVIPLRKRVRRCPRSEVEILQAEIDQLNLEEARLELELQDVLTDITTPEVSEDEVAEDDRPIQVGENVEAAIDQYEEAIGARVVPSVNTPYFSLYMIPEYKRNAERKLIKVKNSARRCNFVSAFNDAHFWREYVRVRDTYPLNGGRDDLNVLVALHCFLNPAAEEADDESSSDESSGDSDDEARDPEVDPPGAGQGILVS